MTNYKNDKMKVCNKCDEIFQWKHYLTKHLMNK